MDFSVSPDSGEDKAIDPFLEDYSRRVATPPTGVCPVKFQLGLLRFGYSRTCDKCPACHGSLPGIERLMEQLLEGTAPANALELIRKDAQTVCGSAECAIGWHIASSLIQALDAYEEEFEEHLYHHRCSELVSPTVPCEALCPAHVDVPGYISYVAEGDYASAIKIIRRDNPFPTACAYVCEHPCENRCRRKLIDAPVNIRGLKKFAVDLLPANQVEVPTAAAPTGKKIAIVGGGPSGLTCAYFCALMGHEVHVYEGHSKLGGMMRYGIPSYRFPREKLDEDIDAILGAGDITVHMQTSIDADVMKKLSAEFDAVYVSIGAQNGRMLGLDGAGAEGVLSAVDLLIQIGDNKLPDFTGKDVVVVGGGNVAMDCARTSVRAGAKSVTVVYRRRIEEMTAFRAEIYSAMQEGVEIMALQSPDHVEVTDGKATALYTQPQLIGRIKQGRPVAGKADKPLVRIPADVVMFAVGQDIVSGPFEMAGMEADRTYLEADDGLKSQGMLENVFVGGDCHLGPKTVILAIGAGKVAARSIDSFLGFNHGIDCGVEESKPHMNQRTPYGRVSVMERPARERKNDFDAVEVEMSHEEAMQEAHRCLRCDRYGCGRQGNGKVVYG